MNKTALKGYTGIYPFDDKYIWFLNKEDIDALITFLDKF